MSAQIARLVWQQAKGLAVRTPRCALTQPPARLSIRAIPASPHHTRSFSVQRSLLVKKYTEDHEWIELDSDGKTGTIGVSTYAAKALGDVVYVELPQSGAEVGAGDTIGAVESVKSASDIMSPVAGTVTEANGKLEETPALINKSPEGEGWIAKIEVTEPTEVNKLMDKDAYDDFTGKEEADS